MKIKKNLERIIIESKNKKANAKKIKEIKWKPTIKKKIKTDRKMKCKIKKNTKKDQRRIFIIYGKTPNHCKHKSSSYLIIYLCTKLL